MFNEILIAADGSEHSVRAAEKAIAIAHGNNKAVLTVVYVIDSSTSKADVLRNWEALGIEEQRKAKLHKIETKIKKAGLSYKVKIIRGEPGPAIVEFANSTNTDLVIVGSRGLNALQEMVLGSVSHKVAKRVNCPVMIVK